MKQCELLERLNRFDQDLDTFIALWKQVVNAIMYSHNSASAKSILQKLNQPITEKSLNLTKQLGALAPFINYFDNKEHKKELVNNFRDCFTLYLKINSPFSASKIEISEIIKVYCKDKIWKLETDIMIRVCEIIGRLESMSPDDDFILDSSSDTPFVYLKESNNKIDINKDDLIIQYLDNLHHTIINPSKKLYLDGHYQKSVEAAIRAMYEYIQHKTGLTIDGDNLINQAFSEKSENSLKFSDLSTPPMKDEQIGFMNMLKGFNLGVRNVFAHRSVVIDPQIAFEYLVMVSLFCKRIDQTKKISISEP